MIGCLAGYVGGGMLGRLLDRALGAVERRVDTIPPAQVVAGTLGAIAGASAAVLLVMPVVAAAPGSGRHPARRSRSRGSWAGSASASSAARA